jgi:hypothetical protein
VKMEERRLLLKTLAELIPLINDSKKRVAK